MPRDFITLSDMPQAVLGITCDLCQRREQFDVEALKREYGGDVKMPELLGRLVADCPRQKGTRRRRRCTRFNPPEKDRDVSYEILRHSGDGGPR